MFDKEDKFLTWISDQDLLDAIGHIVKKYEKTKSDLNLAFFQRNTIDPFTMVFEMSLLQLNLEEWIKNEELRQVGKNIGQSAGEFHQQILGSCDGWNDLGKGHKTKFDLANNDYSIFAEVKNKYNTMNSTTIDGLKKKIEELRKNYNSSKIYVVQIIRKKDFPVNEPIIYKDKVVFDENVRLISGDLFYELVTGEKNALSQLFTVLPSAIEKYIEINKKKFDSIGSKSSSVCSELKRKIQNNKSSPDELPEKAYQYFFQEAYKDGNARSDKTSLFDFNQI